MDACVRMIAQTAVLPFVLAAADGGTESSALVDDNGSEEDYSYEELCQATPRYLQPGGEQLAINEVMSWVTFHSGESLHCYRDGVHVFRTWVVSY